jgi:hypothetical protein
MLRGSYLLEDASIEFSHQNQPKLTIFKPWCLNKNALSTESKLTLPPAAKIQALLSYFCVNNLMQWLTLYVSRTMAKIVKFKVDVIWRKSGWILGDQCIIKSDAALSVGYNARCECDYQAEALRHVNGAMAQGRSRGTSWCACREAMKVPPGNCMPENCMTGTAWRAPPGIGSPPRCLQSQ